MFAVLQYRCCTCGRGYKVEIGTHLGTPLENSPSEFLLLLRKMALARHDLMCRFFVSRRGPTTVLVQQNLVFSRRDRYYNVVKASFPRTRIPSAVTPTLFPSCPCRLAFQLGGGAAYGFYQKTLGAVRSRCLRRIRRESLRLEPRKRDAIERCYSSLSAC